MSVSGLHFWGDDDDTISPPCLVVFIVYFLYYSHRFTLGPFQLFPWVFDLVNVLLCVIRSDVIEDIYICKFKISLIYFVFYRDEII